MTSLVGSSSFTRYRPMKPEAPVTNTLIASPSGPSAARCRSPTALRLAPLDDAPQTLSQRRGGFETEQSLRLLSGSDAIRHKARRLRAILRHQVRFSQFQEDLHKLVDSGSNTHADVEELIGTVRFHAQHVRQCDVFDVDEVVNLAAVAEYHGPLA